MPAAEHPDAATDFSTAGLNTLFDGLAGEGGVAIALSGGPDSTALLHLVLDWRGAMTDAPKIVALTVDHGLREESAAEARDVALQCGKLGVEHHTLTWEGPKPSTSIQAKARKARYNLLAGWCAQHGIKVVLVAHTAEDQAETVVMRKARTRSVESLAGIWPERLWEGVVIRRPLLKVRRLALRRYLSARGISWLEDPSNENDHFERVRVRRRLDSGTVPALVAEAEQAQASVQASQRDANGFLDIHARIGSAGEIQFDRPALCLLDVETTRLILRAVIVLLRGGARAERAELLRLAAWLLASGNGRRTLDGLVFQKTGASVIAGREPGRVPAFWEAVREGMVWDHRFAVAAPVGSRVGAAFLVSGLDRPPGIPHWLYKGLPVVELAGGQRFLAFPAPPGGPLERLGIVAHPTYVNALEGFQVA